jgi:phosphoribosylanthranilate isomerase
MTRVKVCCIANLAEAELAVRHGAAALGLGSRPTSHPG